MTVKEKMLEYTQNLPDNADWRYVKNTFRDLAYKEHVESRDGYADMIAACVVLAVLATLLIMWIRGAPI